MDFQIRPAEGSTPSIGPGFGWQPDLYNKFIDNSHYALDSSATRMQAMTDHLGMKPE